MQQNPALAAVIVLFLTLQVSLVAAQLQVYQCFDITPSLSSSFSTGETKLNITIQFSREVSVTRSLHETKDMFTDFSSDNQLLNYLNQKVEYTDFNIPSEAAVYLLSGTATNHKPSILKRFSRSKVLFGFESLPLVTEFSLIVSNSFRIGSYENEFSSKWTISRTNMIKTENTTGAVNFCIQTFNTTNITHTTPPGDSATEITYEEISNKITFKSNFKELSVTEFNIDGEDYELKQPFHVVPTKQDSLLSEAKFAGYTAPNFEISQGNRNNMTNLTVEHVVSESYVQKLLDDFPGSNTTFMVRDYTFAYKNFYEYPVHTIWRLLDTGEIVNNLAYWYDYTAEMTFSNGERIRIIAEHVNGRTYRLWKIIYLESINGKTCSTGSARNSQCVTCSNVAHGWMSDNTRIYEIMNITSTTHTQSATFDIEVSKQNYSISSATNVANSVDEKVHIEISDRDVDQTIDVLKNHKIIFPARFNIDSYVSISYLLFVNSQFVSEYNSDSIGTGPKVWNSISQQEFCSSSQGSGLKNQLSHFLQNWNQENIGKFSGYYNRFLLNDVQFVKNPACLGADCLYHHFKIQFSKMQKSSVSMNISVDASIIGLKEPTAFISELEMIVNTTRKYENTAKIYANITNSGDFSGNFTVSMNCTNNIIYSGHSIQRTLDAYETIILQFLIISNSKITSNESCTVIANIEKKKLWSNNLKNVNRTMKIQIFDGYLMKLPEFCFGKNSSDSTVCSSHGNCIDENNCTCSNGYTGNECQYPFCFGMNSTDPDVCSKRGICNQPDSCNCSFGYVGSSCEYISCFGKNSSSNSVCSSHGTCISPNKCSCTSGYTGNECEYPICYGKNSTDSAVCSSHGICTSPNKCNCSSGFSGNECKIPICFSKNGSDPNVCSGNGVCSSPNQCSCDVDFTGKDCQYPICFGKNSTDPNACSSHGNCITKNQCACNSGYVGFSCEFSICDGTNSNESTVCSSCGNCLSPNNCNCTAGYTGNNCQLFICFGKNSSSNSVCSSHGTCISPNKCSCTSGYTGNECEYPICYGKNSIDPQVCSGKGECKSSNGCICNSGFMGTECNIAICFGNSATDSNVCSGNGECSSPDKCDCKPSYSGNQCQFTECFNKNSSNSMVCSGNGNCLSLNNCSCSEGYFGSECSNTTCQGILSSNSSVCSGKGVCQKLDQCLCDNGFNGTNCEICLNSKKLSSLIPLNVSDSNHLFVKSRNTHHRNIDIDFEIKCKGIFLKNPRKKCSNITTGNECQWESNFKLIGEITSKFLNTTCTTNSNYTKRVFDSCFEDGMKSVESHHKIDLCKLVDSEYFDKFQQVPPPNFDYHQSPTEAVKILGASMNFSNKTATFKFQLSNSKQIAKFHPILNCSTGIVSKTAISSFVHSVGNHSIYMDLDMLAEEYECSLSFFVEPSACWENEEDKFFIKFSVPKTKTATAAAGYDATWIFVTTPLGVLFLLLICCIILTPLLLLLIFRGKKSYTLLKTISSRNMKANFSTLNLPCEWCFNNPSKYLIQLKKGNEIKLIKICGNPNCFYEHMRVGVADIEKIKSLENQKEISVEDFLVKKMKFHEDILLVKSKKFEIPLEVVVQDQTPPVQSVKMKTEFYVDPKFSIDKYQV
eukprot:gene5991-9989_t